MCRKTAKQNGVYRCDQTEVWMHTNVFIPTQRTSKQVAWRKAIVMATQNRVNAIENERNRGITMATKKGDHERQAVGLKHKRHIKEEETGISHYHPPLHLSLRPSLHLTHHICLCPPFSN